MWYFIKYYSGEEVEDGYTIIFLIGAVVEAHFEISLGRLGGWAFKRESVGD